MLRSLRAPRTVPPAVPYTHLQSALINSPPRAAVFTAAGAACRSCHLLIANHFNPQTLPRGRNADQIDYHCVVCQWAATPIERDIAENSALNLIPLASPRREMAGCQPRAKK